MSTKMSGHCLCGEVTWRSNGPVLWAGHCHCESCRRATASPITSFFGVPRDGLVWRGERRKVLTSQGRVERSHCATCGTQMSYQFDGWPAETHLYAATLDDLTQFKPTEHFHFAEKVPWLEISDTLLKHSGSSESNDPDAG